MTKLLRSSLCSVLVLLSPGLPAYAAVAARVRVAVPATVGPVALPATLPRIGLASSLQSAPSLGLTPTLPAAPAPSLVPTAALSVPAAAPALTAPAVAPEARLAVTAAGVTAAVDSVGDIAVAPASEARGLGARLEDLLLGTRSLGSASELSAPADAPFGAMDSGRHFARAAGDSIREAAEASANDGPAVPTPPAASNDNDGNGGGDRGRGPLLPRLLAAAIALAPAYFLGLPLLAAQAPLVGGLLIATSVGLALMPLLGADSPKLLRAVPGLALGVLGVTAIGVTVSLSYGLGVPTALSLVWPGAFAALGGWGLTRYAVSGPKHRFDRLESVSAFFGGIAAVTGIGLAALGPAGWVGTGILWLSYPLSMMLWAHLPGWMGEGVGAAARSLYNGAAGALRIVGAARRDTVLLDRLQRFSSRMYKTWKGNAVWLGLLVWGPILVVEAAMHLLALASGLVVGAAQAIPMAVWGAVNKLWPEKAVTVAAAEWARLPFDNTSNGKKAWFNKAEVLLLPLANDPSFFKSALGALGIRVLQLAWLAAAPIASLVLSAGGLLVGLSRLGRPYDPARHSPSRLRVSSDDSPGEKPNEPGDDEPVPGGKTPVAAKVFTALLALAPAVFFGLPLVESFSLIRVGFFLAAALPLAAMPFMGKGTPAFLRALPGRALMYNGLFLLLSGHAVLAGIVALLGGWGHVNYLRKLEKGDKERFDEFEVSAFFGSLGAVVGIGAAWAGISGPMGWVYLAFAGLTSPFLLQHLPRWVGEGVAQFFRAFPKSMESFHDVLSFWWDNAFRRNMARHASWWLDKHWTHGIWLSVIWVPTWLVWAAETVLSVALGAVFGAFRAPLAFVAGALDEAKPKSAAARFFKGWVKGWQDSAEGAKARFDAMTKGLQAAMADKTAESGRPTGKAALAFLGARIMQILWLLSAAVMLPLGFFYGLYNGMKKAGETPPADPS